MSLVFLNFGARKVAMRRSMVLMSSRRGVYPSRHYHGSGGGAARGGMTKLISGVLLGGIVVGNWELIRARKEYLSFVDSVAVPSLRILDAEQSHSLGILAAKLGLMPR